MRIDYLASRPAGAIFVAGQIGRGAAIETLGTVIVRSSFDLEGANPRVMVPSSDTSRHQVVMADSPFNVPANGNINTFFAESDIALEKQVVDVVVHGRLRNPSTSGEIRIDGQIWLTRGSPNADEGDSSVNLFGYQARGETPRNLNDPFDFPDDYQAAFNNFYRRSAGFGDIGHIHTSLIGGSVVEISESDNAATSVYRFTLPDPLRLRARYFTYCGHGPDKLPFWNPGPPFDLTPDTLIVDVDANTAAIIWRGAWNFSDHLPALYRTIQVVEEGGF